MSGGYYGGGEWRYGTVAQSGTGPCASKQAEREAELATKLVRSGKRKAGETLRELLGNWPSLCAEVEEETQHPLAELARLYADELLYDSARVTRLNCKSVVASDSSKD